MASRPGGGSTGRIRIVVIGIGNPCRRDDAVGVVFARRLRGEKLRGVAIVEHDGEPGGLIHEWEGMDVAIVVDAARLARNNGTSQGERVYRYEAHAAPLPAEIFRLSTHGFGVAEAVELARELGRMPGRLVVYAVRGDDFGHGEELSPEVDTACDEVVLRVREEIETLLPGEGGC